MSDILLVIVVITAFIFIAVIWLRIRSPRSKAMLNEQIRIQSKNKTVLDTNIANERGEQTPIHGLGKSLLLTILFVVVGGVLLYITYNVHIVKISAWGWSHTLFSLILWGVISTLIAINEKSLGVVTKTLQKVLAMTMIIVFIVFPVGVWISSVGHHSKHRHASKPTATMLLMAPYGNSKILKAKYGYTTSFTGEGFETHCVYTDGHTGIITDKRNSCHSGSILYSYVHDVSGKKNSVLYKFNRVF